MKFILCSRCYCKRPPGELEAGACRDVVLCVRLALSHWFTICAAAGWGFDPTSNHPALLRAHFTPGSVFFGGRVP